MEESSLASLLNLELKSHIWATHSHSVPRDDSLNVAYKDFCYRVVCCCSPCFKCHSSSSFIAFFSHTASCFRELAQGLPSAHLFFSPFTETFSFWWQWIHFWNSYTAVCQTINLQVVFTFVTLATAARVGVCWALLPYLVLPSVQILTIFIFP